MGRIVHVVCGASAAGTLREVLHHMGSTADVAVFPCALRYGALFRDFGDESLRRYAGEVERLTGGCGLFGPLRAFVGMDFVASDRVVVWHGDDVDERLMYYMVCALAPAAPLFEVDVAAVRPMLKHCGRGVSLSICSVENVEWLYGRIVPVDGLRMEAAAAAWNRWRCSDAALRIVSDDGIAEVAEDFFDGTVVAACGAEYRKAARVVGEALCATDFAVGDGFLQRRIVALLRAGRLSARAEDVSERMRRAIAAAGIVPVTVGGVDVSALPLFSIAAVR